METFPQFSRLPPELQEKILTTNESNLKSLPFLCRSISITSKKLVYRLKPTLEEFRLLLETEKPLRFCCHVAINKCYLFNLVESNAYETFWHVTCIMSLERKYYVYHLNKKYQRVEGVNVTHGYHTDLIHSVGNVISLLFCKYDNQEFDPLTLFKIVQRRTRFESVQDQNDIQTYLSKFVMDDTLDIISEKHDLANKSETSSWLHVEVYVILVGFAWVFNLGHLIQFESILDSDSISIKRFQELSELILKRLPELTKMIPILC